MAGSLRYMSPENALGKGIDLSADVYSFGVLLWELCTLQKPFQKFSTHDEFMRVVIKGNWRPAVVSIPIPPIRGLIQRCWDEDRSNRPTFEEIILILEDVVENDGKSGLGGRGASSSLSMSSLHDSGLSHSASMHGLDGINASKLNNNNKKRPSLRKSLSTLGRSSSNLLNGTTNHFRNPRSTSSSNLFKTIRTSLAMSASSMNGSGFFKQGDGSKSDFQVLDGDEVEQLPSGGARNASWDVGASPVKSKRQASMEAKIKEALLSGGGDKSSTCATKQRSAKKLNGHLSAASRLDAVGHLSSSSGNMNASWNVGNQMRAKICEGQNDFVAAAHHSGTSIGTNGSASRQIKSSSKATASAAAAKISNMGRLLKQNSIPELAYSEMADDDEDSLSLDMSDLKDPDAQNDIDPLKVTAFKSPTLKKSAMKSNLLVQKKKFHSSMSSLDGF